MNQRTLLVALVAVFALTLISAPSAEANCYYPHTTTIEYWMWVAKNDPNDHYCFNENGPIISPPIQLYYDWELVGEETWDCDNNYSSWGDLSCDEGSSSAWTGVRRSASNCRGRASLTAALAAFPDSMYGP